jgi:4-amino-4-deoxy-L-arabinose transferase-like glycosyltransferase
MHWRMNKSSLRRGEIVFLVFLTLAGFCVRCYQVGTVSLAEDEAAKWSAIQEYKQRHYVGVNPEHPPLMKLLAWGSVALGERWNRWAGGREGLHIREEAALRLPNLIFGALTIIVVYLLGREMLGVVGASAAAFFWAFTPLPIALNRILKEDTLVAFFTCLALYLFWRGKKTADNSAAGRLFMASGVCFGLSLASKYYLHFIGLNLLVWHIAGKFGLDQRPFLKPFGKRFWLALALAFVLADPLILSPTHDLAILHYVGARNVAHHGYILNGHLYGNTLKETPFGVPWYFYVWALGVKTPIPVLLATLLGLVFVFSDRRTLASVFLRIMLVLLILPFSLVAAKWIRYLLDMLPFVFLIAGYGAEKIHEGLRLLEWPTARRMGLAAAGIALVAWPAAETVVWSPLYPLYLNSLGGGRSNMARIFPHDEVYDLGVREAVEFTCKVAPLGARLAVSNPLAVSYYLQKCGRGDILVGVMYDPRYLPRRGDFLLIQESRRYFETEDLFREVARTGRELREVGVEGVVTARIYRF